MADHENGEAPRDPAPGWLFRLNTTLGARLNAPAWMGSPASGEAAAANEAVPAVEAKPPASTNRPR